MPKWIAICPIEHPGYTCTHGNWCPIQGSAAPTTGPVRLLSGKWHSAPQDTPELAECVMFEHLFGEPISHQATHRAELVRELKPADGIQASPPPPPTT